MSTLKLPLAGIHFQTCIAARTTLDGAGGTYAKVVP